MSPVVNFIIALIVATMSLASGSLAWPKLTSHERPKLLQEVHDVVLKTEPGQKMADVLGVIDESQVQVINFGSLAASVSGSVRDAIQKRMQTIVVGNAVNQLKGQFDKLPKDEQIQIQEALCKPVE